MATTTTRSTKKPAASPVKSSGTTVKLTNPNKIMKTIHSPNTKEEKKKKNTIVFRSYATLHPGIAVYMTSKLFDRNDDGWNHPLVKAVEQNHPVAMENRLFFVGKVRATPELDQAAGNSSNGYLRRLFVQVDTEKGEVYTSAECLQTIHNLCLVSIAHFLFENSL